MTDPDGFPYKDQFPIQDDDIAREVSPRLSRARVRAKTISIKRLPKREHERARMENPVFDHDRPEIRGDCQHGQHAERPCPFVSCKHHLYLDVDVRTGSIKMNFPDLEVWDLPETCALDIADRGGVTLEDVAAVMNLTRERVRQIEMKGIVRIRAIANAASLSDYLENERDIGYISDGRFHLRVAQ